MNFILNQILNQILNLIYPPKCGICGKLHNEFLCKKCEKLLNSEALFQIEDYSKDLERYFEEHLYIFMYQGIIRKEIINYKFNQSSYLYKTFVNFLLKNKKFVGILKTYDIMISVPISNKRYLERGYNQSELIAKQIAKNIEIKYLDKCLIKVKNNATQSTLNKEERMKNVVGTYKIKNIKSLEHKKIILFDDIYTTGSTVNECCKILKQANADKISILTLAKD